MKEQECDPITVCQPVTEKGCHQVSREEPELYESSGGQVEIKVPQEVCHAIQREVCEQETSKGEMSV